MSWCILEVAWSGCCLGVFLLVFFSLTLSALSLLLVSWIVTLGICAECKFSEIFIVLFFLDNSISFQNKKNSSTSKGSKPESRAPKVTSEVRMQQSVLSSSLNIDNCFWANLTYSVDYLFMQIKNKVQKLKDTRDYSFLLSENAEIPAPTKVPPPKNVSVRNSGVLLLY